MKIGILTYHKAHNYGALLQAIALRVVLQRDGNEVSYIDYWPKYHNSKYQFFSFIQFRYGLHRYLIHRICNFKPILRRIKVFKNDIAKYIEPYCKKSGSYDVIIYGSDQIWRRQFETGQYNPIYFGNNTFEAKKHFSYAASMGIINLSNSEENQIKNWVSRFYTIGVREPDLQILFQELGYSSHLNTDPTLLLNSNDWDKIFNTRRLVQDHYLFYYNLNKDTFNRKAIEQYSHSHNLRIIEVFGSAHKEQKDSYSAKNLSEFVSLIKYADVVLSTSYHGMIFSIIYNKNVIVSFKSNAKRSKSLLELLDIADCMVEPNVSDLPDINIDYTNVNQILSDIRGESLKFLMENIGNCNQN